MVWDKCTLLIRHLPNDLSAENVEEMLKMFGAVRVRTVAVKGGKMQQVAFATFDNVAAAESALQRLHQLEVCGRRLVVVYALESQLPAAAPGEDLCTKVDQTQESEPSTATPADYSGNVGLIAELLGLSYPFSPQLRYRYPAPTPATIHNIAATLVNVPKFYWQVLHLMNKMNLPPPFESAEHSIQNLLAFDRLWQFGQQQPLVTASSGEESELESDHETDGIVPTVMAKRKRPGTTSKVSKRSRISSLLAKPTVAENLLTIPPGDVFELANAQSAKKIEFKISAEALAAKRSNEAEVDDASAAVDSGTFGTLTATVKMDSEPAVDEVTTEASLFITDKLLRENRISSEGMSILPVFKNYQAGKASMRLYLKNLAKQVEEKDLQFIYGRYVSHLADDEKEAFNIRLMKEGRMKGQAFITFPDADLASAALNDTNGYVLHGKPIVVQYAHHSKS